MIGDSKPYRTRPCSFLMCLCRFANAPFFLLTDAMNLTPGEAVSFSDFGSEEWFPSERSTFLRFASRNLLFFPQHTLAGSCISFFEKVYLETVWLSFSLAAEFPHSLLQAAVRFWPNVFFQPFNKLFSPSNCLMGTPLSIPRFHFFPNAAVAAEQFHVAGSPSVFQLTRIWVLGLWFL